MRFCGLDIAGAALLLAVALAACPETVDQNEALLMTAVCLHRVGRRPERD